MIKVRRNVFETNSSSRHSLSISKDKQNQDDSLGKDETLFIELGEYCWGYDELHTAGEKLNYVLTEIHYNVINKAALDIVKDLVLQKTGCDIEIENYNDGNAEKELIAGSIPSSEHACMSLSGFNDEFDTFKRFITKIYPSGVVGIVSDTWDYWKVITDYLPRLKETIINRNGRLVIRGDSGDPVKIICGDINAKTEHEQKGSYELMWEIFGGTVNEKGYKVLHPAIGYIYGDSITLERQSQILAQLEAKGFTASNLALGIGSYTYQYCTRDTHGFAMKATWGQVNGVARDIFKDPKTDSGVKKSHKGLLRVNEDFTVKNQCTVAESDSGLLIPVFKDGKLLVEQSLSEIRQRVG